MPTYNNAAFLPAALESVLRQSFGDWELLVINDASSDNTDDILEIFKNKDRRIFVWNNQANRGLTRNLNFALGKAKGQYIARLDSDDIWSDNRKLQKQADFLNHNPGCCLVGSWAEAFGADNKKSFAIKYPTADREIRGQLLLRNCFVHSSILARKASLLAAGGYDLKWQYIEDYALWMKLGLSGSLANLPEIMVRYRLNNVGITRTKNSGQIRNVLSLIKQYGSSYPGYKMSVCKWYLQYALSFTGLMKGLDFLKHKI